MLVSPLDNDDVVSPVSYDVPALVVVLAFVLELDLVAGSLGPVDADVEDVVTYEHEKLVCTIDHAWTHETPRNGPSLRGVSYNI